MKFSIDRVTLERMVKHLGVERGVKGPRESMMRISACVARVFVEANGVTAGVEALVLEDGACSVPRMKFLKVLRTFAPKPAILVSVDEDGLRIENFLMKVTDFSPKATAPGKFPVSPVKDTWLAQPKTPQSSSHTISPSLDTRRRE
jgi:hypothetical protein